MCGISLLLANVGNFKLDASQEAELAFAATSTEGAILQNNTQQVLVEKLTQIIAPRGPDGVKQITLEISSTENESATTTSSTSSKSISTCLIASLLALRGTAPTMQPLIHENKHFFLWNGEIFGGELFEEISKNNLNDSETLFKQLIQCGDEQAALKVIAGLKGAFAFVYYNVEKRFMLFGKDQLGKRSLLYSYDGNTFVMSSTACSLGPNTAWNDISVNGIYCIRFPITAAEQVSLEIFSWRSICEKFNSREVLFPRTHSIPTESNEQPLTEETVKQFVDSLSTAVKRRVTQVFDTNTDNTTRIGVLFSGGIDSVMITALAHLNADPKESIDLMNVSFGSGSSVDRRQSLLAHEELKALYPERKFRLVLVDVPNEEIEKHRPEIEKLIYPNSTILDFSIGSALWFSSRGKGKYIENNVEIEYTSTAKVILLGIGSDEQLAGYGRHRTRFNRKGWEGLAGELDLDVKRLWVRNLARDDRIISSHGKEVRSPFLDEDFIAFVRELPLWQICDLSLPPGEGDKMIIRRAAHMLGLAKSAVAVKRAIQFGCNIAKIMKKKNKNKKQKGTDAIKIQLEDEEEDD